MQRATRWSMAAIALGMSLAAVSGALAQQKAPPPIPDALVRKMIELGLKNIGKAVCDGFNACAAATEAELKEPPITLEQARAVILVGGRSAIAHWCGLDAERRSVLPLLTQLRRSKAFNERQMALMAVIHGIQQSIVLEQLKAKGKCDAATRSKADAQLPK
jgi:hypothetical protein